MLNILTDSIDNALSVISDLAEGETPTRRQVAKLIADGVTVYAIAQATGVAVDVIQELANRPGD